VGRESLYRLNVTLPAGVTRDTPAFDSKATAFIETVRRSPAFIMTAVRFFDPGSGLPFARLLNGSRPTL
jgi:hypothetical protein